MDQKESKVFFYPSRLKDPQRYPPSPFPRFASSSNPLFIGRSSGSPPPEESFPGCQGAVACLTRFT